MDDDNGKKKVRQCSCGRFLKKSDRKYCYVCRQVRELGDMKRQDQRLKKQISQLENQNRFCQDRNKELNKEITTLKSKKKYPCWLHIKAHNWDITHEYLEKVLKAIAPFGDTIQVEYGRYPGR